MSARINCPKCIFHVLINDPDPYDSFCSDDVAVVCKKVENNKRNRHTKYLSDRSDFKVVESGLRPYQVKQVKQPEWCPLLKDKIDLAKLVSIE